MGKKSFYIYFELNIIFSEQEHESQKINNFTWSKNLSQGGEGEESTKSICHCFYKSATENEITDSWN